MQQGRLQLNTDGGDGGAQFVRRIRGELTLLPEHTLSGPLNGFGTVRTAVHSRISSIHDWKVRSNTHTASIPVPGSPEDGINHEIHTETMRVAKENLRMFQGADGPRKVAPGAPADRRRGRFGCRTPGLGGWQWHSQAKRTLEVLRHSAQHE
ncbi:hypothetical protein Pth03_03610 [Planotetraspora thailandica]|uniref:Uncharacterized protein n=1 Tax=Planotetraspora thailandica TaxID=487172 RepID=A0A8J3UY39_9ACTN|nr:hypothetical protein Pth03_03610 [Planotetraspora thailandica]